MQTKPPIITMQQSLAKEKAEASKDTLADSLEEVKARKVAGTLPYLQGAALAATLAKSRSQDDCQNAGRRGRQANVVAK